ncbi:transcription regulator HTH, apses-type DNA-binding domain-containing protein [Choanephora cucurbitarum]|nr:transcription regulator HTH, apses-type DNA-binding domain-containing protein [Choanephora cucurbitarum]
MIPSSNAPSVYASNTTQSLTQNQRPRITTSLWDDEGTVCYQVDVRGICVARRQDNDMINGTKLLNVTGMSRGKRDGILKNEKGRVVVKVGAMHLKGVWVTFARAKALAVQFNIVDHLHPLFVDDPALYFYSNQHNYLIPNHPVYLQSAKPTGQYNARPSSLYNAELVNYTPELPAPCVPSMIPLYGYSHLHPH